MAHEGDARAITMRRVPMRIRRPLPLPRPLISEQTPPTSCSSPSMSDLKRRKKWETTFDYLDDDDVEDLDDFLVQKDGDLGSGGGGVDAPPADVRVNKAAVANVTVGDADALDCGVCFLALRPPIFQCEVGHVVCSACRDKLEATGNGRCHVCRGGGGGYRRCHAMERLVDCIRVPCPYAAHGCDATPPYHGRDSHIQVCPHAPFRCPGGSCGGGFIGSTAALLDHLASAHDWLCTKVYAREAFVIRLHDGFNFFLLADDDAAAANCGVPCRLFLLNMTKERLGRAISVLCIHPHTHTSTAANGGVGAHGQRPSTQCELVFSRHGDRSSSTTTSSVFSVVCTDLSNGLPNHEGCFQFFVPNAVLGLGEHESSIQVKARIIN